MKVLIDDVRDMDVDVIIRNPHKISLLENTDIDILYLDHDLGVNSFSGYEVIITLIEGFYIYPNTVILVTSNPVGRDRIGNYLLDNGYKSIGSSKTHFKYGE